MDKGIHVKSAAFTYRFFFREIVGALFAIAVTGGVGMLLFFLHIEGAVGYSLLLLISVFALQIILIFLISSLEYSNLIYLLEQNSLSLKKGVFSVETETIPFQKIKNASFDQSFAQRLFGVGNILIDQDTEKFIWSSIDKESADVIMEAVADKSNIQPIAVSAPIAHYPLQASPESSEE